MSQLNPLNDLSRVYLDHVSKINQQNESDDIKRWQEGENDLQKQIRISSGIIASGGAPTMEEEKKAAKDYDGDGKIESGKDEYFGSKDKAIKKAMGKKVKEEKDPFPYDDDIDDLEAAVRDTKMKKALNKKAMMKKEETHNYVEAYVTELNKATMGSYVKKEELELDEAERSIDDRLDRKNKLMKKTTRKAMQFARDEGEASGHARFNMSRLGREREKLIAKKK